MVGIILINSPVSIGIADKSASRVGRIFFRNIYLPHGQRSAIAKNELAFVAIGDAVGLTLIVFAEQPAITMLAAAMHSRAKNHFFT